MKNLKKLYNMNIQLFAEDNDPEDPTPAEEDKGQDASAYIEAIKELKENSVSKEDYEKLKKENKQLIQSLVNGESYQGDEKSEPTETIKDLRNDLFDNENTNIEYISKALKLRDQLMENGEPDPFLPIGSKVAPTADDVEAANRVAAALQSCIDIADGDPEIFNRELQRILVDNVNVSISKNNKRR